MCSFLPSRNESRSIVRISQGPSVVGVAPLRHSWLPSDPLNPTAFKTHVSNILRDIEINKNLICELNYTISQLECFDHEKLNPYGQQKMHKNHLYHKNSKYCLIDSTSFCTSLHQLAKIRIGKLKRILDLYDCRFPLTTRFRISQHWSLYYAAWSLLRFNVDKAKRGL